VTAAPVSTTVPATSPGSMSGPLLSVRPSHDVSDALLFERLLRLAHHADLGNGVDAVGQEGGNRASGEAERVAHRSPRLLHARRSQGGKTDDITGGIDIFDVRLEMAVHQRHAFAETRGYRRCGDAGWTAPHHYELIENDSVRRSCSRCQSESLLFECCICDEESVRFVILIDQRLRCRLERFLSQNSSTIRQFSERPVGHLCKITIPKTLSLGGIDDAT
jgi:hypothetical protein